MKIDWKSKEKIIKKLYNRITIAEMSKRLNLNYQTLYKKILRMRKEGELPKARGKEYRKENNTIKLKIAELDGNVELGRKYRIEKQGGKDKFATTEFTGKLIQKTDRFYTFKNKNRAESFLKVDFVIGEYLIEEV